MGALVVIGGAVAGFLLALGETGTLGAASVFGGAIAAALAAAVVIWTRS